MLSSALPKFGESTGWDGKDLEVQSDAGISWEIASVSDLEATTLKPLGISASACAKTNIHIRYTHVHSRIDANN